MPDPRPGLLPVLLEELGVSTIVHGGGTKSSMGGSTVHPDVGEVMRASLDSFFDVEQLLAAVGDGCAKQLGVESAAVVGGAASGCVLAAAALLPRGRAPGSGRPHLVTQRRHYGRYTYLYEQGGCAVREIGTMNDCPLEWYDEAIDADTVGIAWLEGPGIRSAGADLRDVCTLAAERGLPVVVDAAAMAYPFDTIRGYLRDGADLVVISGGKLLGGPQASGLVLGVPALVERVREIAFPHQGVGRAHKITKEAALGAYAAVRRFVADEGRQEAALRVRADRFVNALRANGLEAGTEQNSRHLLPAVVLRDVRAGLGRRPSACSARLLRGERPLFLPYDDARDELFVEFASLPEEDDDWVLRQVQALTVAPGEERRE